MQLPAVASITQQRDRKRAALAPILVVCLVAVHLAGVNVYTHSVGVDMCISRLLEEVRSPSSRCVWLVTEEWEEKIHVLHMLEASWRVLIIFVLIVGHSLFPRPPSRRCVLAVCAFG